MRNLPQSTDAVKRRYRPLSGQPSKAQRIRALSDGVRSTAEIASLIGCLPEYVRVIRQRAKATYSKAEAKYLTSKWGEKTVRAAVLKESRAYYSDPVHYRKHLDRMKLYRKRWKSEARP